MSSPEFFKKERVCKPGSVFGSHLSWSRLAAALEQPTQESNEAGRFILLYMVLYRMGFTVPSPSPGKR